jgi:RHS repeat-associated protein
MVGNINPWTYQELVLADGSRLRFDRITPGTSYTDGIFLHTSSSGPFYGARITRNVGLGWTMTLKDGTKYDLPEAMGQTNPFCQAIIGITDRYGNHITLDRSSAADGCLLMKITSSNGRSITLTHDAQGRITQATDNIGRNVLYTYDAAGRLSTVTDAATGVTTYTYDDQNRMLTIKDARNIVYLTNQYDSAGRVILQTAVDTGTYAFAWTPTANPTQTRFYSTDPNPGAVGGSVILRNGCWNPFGYNRYSAACGGGYMPLVAQVDVTDPRGYVERVTFGPAGYKTSDIHALGQPEQQTETLSYYADNLLQSVIDPLGRTTSFDYDAQGNMSRITRLDGTPDAVTTNFAYEPSFNQLQSVTDPLGHSTTLAYDSSGELTSVTDPLNHQIVTTFNGLGQMLTLTDPLGNTTTFNYFGGDLVQVVDPVGNGSTLNYDLAGRVTTSSDAQGNTTRYQYSPLNLVTQVTDPKSNNTTFSYDPNGNLLSLTDALHLTAPTTWTYDNMDRVLTRTDPLLRQEHYSYDFEGNLVSSTDRKNQVTSLTYDPLNRLKLVGYNTVVNAGVTSYESTVGYTYDAGNRMTQAVDSAGGIITEAYDNLNRVTSETTPQGQISYGYDLAGRRASMTVAGQPQVTYSYDNVNRLMQIAQGTSTVGFSYDTANRRSTLTLSNGVNMSYTYDNDSRVTGITYKFNANTLGNLTYSYDSLGRRTQVGGSFAQTGLPGSISSATYDAANELTNWNGTPISYDLNGNMLSDGTNSFSWNARNQVATLNSVSLQYDGFGRRTKNLQNTSFLFDGANAVQELSGTTPTANLISGGIDEIFTRADSSGAFTPLKDALGSTIALVDASGNLATQYSYDPFGNTTVSGATNSNGFQYTGRENEDNGLYFYRARYYSPVLHRFISEDPLGFAGSGPNFYGYAFNSPTNLVDPSGMSVGVDDIGTALRLIGATQDEIDEVVERILQLGGAGWLARLGAYCATNPVCLLAAVDVGLAINDGIDVYHLGQAYGWWAQPKSGSAPAPVPNPAPSLAGRKDHNDDDNNEEPDCKKASDWHLEQAGIEDEHAFKKDHVGGSVSQYDICACSDGSIKIKAQGACGKSGPSIHTGLNWQ